MLPSSLWESRTYHVRLIHQLRFEMNMIKQALETSQNNTEVQRLSR